ncbi:MAG: CIA30 family protein [Steroidobacteraceae bacterium]|nr:CIA30 family protein [Steroidobacteraceae bacterium]
MNTIPYPRMSASRLVAAYAGDIRLELFKMLRTPAFALPTLFFPAMFYLLFGVLLARGNGAATVTTFAHMGVFGTMAPGLFGFGVSLAFDREQGLLRFKQALPMPPGSYLLARMVMAMLFVALISVSLTLLAWTVAGAPITPAQAAKVFLIEVLGVLPFCALGLCIGAFVSGQAAPAIVNLIYLPMAFLSGLWVPLQFLPKAIQGIATFLPSHHLAQLALGALDLPSKGSTASHVAALAGVTLVFFVLAMRRLGNRGFRLINPATPGGRPRFATAMSGVAIAIGIALMSMGVIGNPSSAVAAAGASKSDADAATAAKDSAAPAGVAAPSEPLIAAFDSGSPDATYGIGWSETSDTFVGGASTATVRLVDDGAESSTGALEIDGTIREGFQWPFAGAVFFPNGPPMEGMMDYSSRKTLAFFARGDGGKYVATFFSTADRNSIPSSFPFEAGPEWREIRVPLEDFVVDRGRVRGIMIGSNGPEGHFRLQIDNVRIE